MFPSSSKLPTRDPINEFEQMLILERPLSPAIFSSLISVHFGPKVKKIKVKHHMLQRLPAARLRAGISAPLVLRVC